MVDIATPVGNPRAAAGSAKSESPRALIDLPPENETVTLHFSHAALPGWMSRRFLRGTPTWWALIDGRAQLVEPIGWSPVP